MSDIARQAADLLLAVRAGGPRIMGLPEALRPTDRAQAYAIQRLVAGDAQAIGGWKVGPAEPEAPAQCSPIPAAAVLPSPARIADGTLRGIEAEVAFRMGADLPPRSTPYTRQEVTRAIATAHPVIEPLDSRYGDPDSLPPLTNLADSQINGGLVWGPGRADWHDIDFDRETVQQFVDGALHTTHTGNPAGDMIRLMVWLANEGAAWAGGLKAGQFVTCGSWTGKTYAAPGTAVRVHFPSLGEVRLDFG